MASKRSKLNSPRHLPPIDINTNKSRRSLSHTIGNSNTIESIFPTSFSTSFLDGKVSRNSSIDVSEPKRNVILKSLQSPPLRVIHIPSHQNLIRPLNLSDNTTGHTVSKLQVGKYVLDSQRMNRVTSRTVRGIKPIEINGKDLIFVKNLGSGAYGNVKLMKHITNGCLYAVKSLCKKSEEENTIEKEICSVEFNQHPNLVRTINAFVHDNTINVIQEYADIGSLSDVIQKFHPLPEYLIKGIAFQILRGLAFLHSSNITSITPRTSRKRGYVHRDIKPENILLNSKGEVKIGDYGLMASTINGVRSSFVGTSMYMSPERIRGGVYSDKSDIWSYGITILEMVLGQCPFQNENKSFIDLMVTVTSFDPTVDLPNNMNLSEEGCEHLIKCLQNDPEQRSCSGDLLEHIWVKDQINCIDVISNWFKNNDVPAETNESE